MAISLKNGKGETKMTQWTSYVEDLNIPKNWECTSYGNDALPSYQFNGYHIWVDSWDETERKINSTERGGNGAEMFPRFMVTNADCYNGECDSQCNECYESLFETDNFNEVINFVSNNKEQSFTRI